MSELDTSSSISPSGSYFTSSSAVSLPVDSSSSSLTNSSKSFANSLLYFS
jgi:hypothetical protein